MLSETGRGRDVRKDDHRSLRSNKRMRIRDCRSQALIFLLGWVLAVSVFPVHLWAEEHVPAVNAISINLGYTYDPSDNIFFSQVSVLKLYDYDAIWPHKAPVDLRFKVEVSLGGSRLDNAEVRLNASVNIFALYYLAGLETHWVRPYVEAGIGGIYTDYRVCGQDYRFNFNPQAGVGMDIKNSGAHPWFVAMRVHHISNGGIGSSNRGQNSVVCLFGSYF